MTTFPEIAKEWHPTKNGNLKPSQVTSGTAKKVWWKCRKGDDHEWPAAIASRASGRRCPFCSGKKVSNTNNLEVNFPDLAKEWHPTRNGNLGPNQVTSGSGKKVWWKCPKGDDHEWSTSISNRASRGSGCPHCFSLKRRKGKQILSEL